MGPVLLKLLVSKGLKPNVFLVDAYGALPQAGVCILCDFSGTAPRSITSGGLFLGQNDKKKERTTIKGYALLNIDSLS
ncbi:hypothetical protein SCG7109_BB_00100 [Chlamydiales bacterium SCGC AG-110-M15]|nr:hypothetical protein SCG7109_BB_00100 [Chlamydiales bacterium SCGC AG-110-M15]